MEKRIARICWNTNGWVKPSGRLGKSKSKSHEKKYGFGHEEWLFDMDKVLGDYHYGFLEPVLKFQDKYCGEEFEVLLYTIDGLTHQKYWVGTLDSVKVIDQDEAKSVVVNYKSRGWLRQMKNDLDAVGLNGNRIVNDYLEEVDIINVKFRPEAIRGVLEKPFSIPRDQARELITATRYVLLKTPEGDAWHDVVREQTGYRFETGNDRTTRPQHTVTMTFQQRSVELEVKHDVLATAFLKFLKEHYGNENAKRECKAYGSSRIDIVRKTAQGDIFYEVKTYNHLKTSIRDAIGQLLEYCFFPDVRYATKLVLVSDIEPDEQERAYISQLQGILDIPFGYVHFDTGTNTIVSEM